MAASDQEIEQGRKLFLQLSPAKYKNKLETIPGKLKDWLSAAFHKEEKTTNIKKDALEKIEKFLDKKKGEKFCGEGGVYPDYDQKHEQLVAKGKIYFEIYTKDMKTLRKSEEKLPKLFENWADKETNEKYHLRHDGLSTADKKAQKHYKKVKKAVQAFLDFNAGKTYKRVFGNDNVKVVKPDKSLIFEGKTYFEIYTNNMGDKIIQNEMLPLPKNFDDWAADALWNLAENKHDDLYQEKKTAVTAFLKANIGKTFAEVFGKKGKVKAIADGLFGDKEQGKTYFEIYTKNMGDKKYSEEILPKDFYSWVKTASSDLYGKTHDHKRGWSRYEKRYEEVMKDVTAFLKANKGKKYADVFGNQQASAMMLNYGYDDDGYLYGDNGVHELWSIDDDDKYRYIGYDGGYENGDVYYPQHAQIQNHAFLEGTLLILVVLLGCVLCACVFVVSFATGWYVGGRPVDKKPNSYEQVADNDDHL